MKNSGTGATAVITREARDTGAPKAVDTTTSAEAADPSEPAPPTAEDYRADVEAAQAALDRAKADFDLRGVEAAKRRLTAAQDARAMFEATRDREAREEVRKRALGAIRAVAPELADKIGTAHKASADIARAALAEASRRGGLVDSHLGEIADHVRVVSGLYESVYAICPDLAPDIIAAKQALPFIVGTRLRDAGVEGLPTLMGGSGPASWQRRQVNPARVSDAA